jgi:hypothetical protein
MECGHWRYENFECSLSTNNSGTGGLEQVSKSYTFHLQEYPIYSKPFFVNDVVAKPSNSLLLLRFCA